MIFSRGNKKNTWKIITGFLLLVVLYFGWNVYNAHAINVIDWFSGDLLLAIPNTLLLVVKYIAGVLIKLGVFLVTTGIKFNQTLLDSINGNGDNFVSIGWGIFRDLANLGFVLGIIIIAIATILRFKSYSAQSLLPKLIGAALIVNFSLVIAGAIIKVSDGFSNFFLGYIGGQGSGDASLNVLGKKMMDKFYVEKNNIPQLPNGPGDATTTKTEEQKLSDTSIALKDMTTTFITILIFFFIFLTLLALAGAFFIRYFYLAFLLMISPLVWLLWVFPYTKKYWNDWWSSFVKWMLFAPVMIFFLWLTLLFLDKGGDLIFKNTAGSIDTSSASDAASSIAGLIFGNLMVPLMAGGMLIAGLRISQKMGFSGASLALDRSKSLGNWAKSKAKRGAARVGRRALGEPTRKAINWVGASKVANTLTFGRASVIAQKATGARASLEKASQGFIEKSFKEYDAIDSKKLAALIPTMTNEERMAAMEVLSKRGDMKEIVKTDGSSYVGSIDQIVSSIENARNIGRNKEAGSIEKSFGMTSDMMRAVKAGKGVKIRVKNPDGSYKKDKDGNFVENTYEELAKKYYEGFSSDDWKKVASAIGNPIFDPSDPPKNLPGMNAEQSKLFRDEYISGLSGGFGESISATAPKLKRENAREMLRQIVESTVGKEGGEEEDIQIAIKRANEAKDFDKVTELVAKRDSGVQTIKTGVGGKEILEAIKADELDVAIDLMKKSGDTKLASIGAKLGKSMGAALYAGGEERGEAKSESKPEPKPEKK